MGVVVRNVADLGAATSLYGISAEELAGRDAFQRSVGRWFAYEDDAAVGMAPAFVRPDDRLFVVHRLTSETTFGPLLEAAVSDLRRDAYGLSTGHFTVAFAPQGN